MYLANDVIQNSKKRGPEFGKEFGNVLRKSFEAVASSRDEKTIKSLTRLLDIWDERGVYEKPMITEFRKGLGEYLLIPLSISSYFFRNKALLLTNLFLKTSCKDFVLFFKLMHYFVTSWYC